MRDISCDRRHRQQVGDAIVRLCSSVNAVRSERVLAPRILALINIQSVLRTTTASAAASSVQVIDAMLHRHICRFRLRF